MKPEARELPMEATSKSFGSPFMPTGDAMDDGVGAASWAPRRDVPELDGKGHPKLRPMSHCEGFIVSAGTNPVGMKVGGRDKKLVGHISELWVDEPEQLIRYLEIELTAELGGGKRLVPMPLCKINPGYVAIRSLTSDRFAGIPTTKSDDKVTLLEEDKISGYVAGGNLYC
jgi:photosynthetic reaction center H subunit